MLTFRGDDGGAEEMMVEWLAELGYDATEDGVSLTVPTKSSFSF